MPNFESKKKGMDNFIEPTTKMAESALNTAESISNYGAMVVITAFAIILCTVMIIYFFVSHRRMTRNMEEQNKRNNEALSVTLKELKDYLAPVSENARLSTLTALYAIAENNFKLSIENVIKIIEQIQTENNISNEKPLAPSYSGSSTIYIMREFCTSRISHIKDTRLTTTWTESGLTK